MKSNGWLLCFAALVAVSPVYGSGRAGNSAVRTNPQGPVLKIVDDGTTTIDNVALLASLPSAADGLTAEEKAGILLMREEEKLARDVYDALAKKWGGRPFSNISRAESTHMDAVKVLIDRYKLADPVQGKGPGEFVSTQLQKLHDDFVKRGAQSLADALKVGAEIEDLDIADLLKLSAQTEKTDIKTVYQNLVRGSENHLRAFTSVLMRRTDQTYSPKYISRELFDQIIGKR